MNIRTVAPVIATFLLLAPLVSATHMKEEGPPDSTFGYIGGLVVAPILNGPPVEINIEAGTLTNQDFPTGQRLQSAATYDCATGQRSIAPGASKYLFEVVPVNQINWNPAIIVTSIGLNDHLVNSAGNTIDGSAAGQAAGTTLGDNATGTSYVYYGANPFLGYGTEQPTTLLPGIIRFVAYLSCGGKVTGVLPEALPGQTKGIYGFHDEKVWQALTGPDSQWDPEFGFVYVSGLTNQAGLLLPGDLTTPGWYNDAYLIYTPAHDLQANTFRWVVNPSFVDAYPGYAGSRFEATEHRCLVNGEAGATGGTFGNCADAKGPRSYTEERDEYSYFFPPVEPESPSTPAPVLEDVDVVSTPEAGILGSSAIEPAVIEAYAAADAAWLAVEDVAPTTEKPRELEPNHPEDDSVTVVGNDWSYYFDVQKFTSYGVGVTTLDPLYNADLTQRRDAYPGFANFAAYFGLARDANGDDVINFASRSEWWPLDDSLVYASNGTRIANFADVGSLEVDGNDLITSENVVAMEWCTEEPIPYNAGDRIPIGSPDIENCNSRGNATEGWGTFWGGNSAGGTGYYSTFPDFFAVQGSAVGEWRTSVKARIVWPTVAEFEGAGLPLPAGLSILSFAGKTATLTDVDVYGTVL